MIQIFIDTDELKGIKPLQQFIIQLLIEQGIARANSFQGAAGFGRHQWLFVLSTPKIE